MLREERVGVIDAFLADYTKIRLAEGRGSDDPSFYRDLPECPPDHATAWQWSIRRQTFRCLRSRVLPMLGLQRRVLDLGAGTGWLSNRLALLEHRPCAVDLSCDDHDGLGAARHFRTVFPRVQAEFDALPFPDGAADVVIFNASLHYSTDYSKTLSEALRSLAPGGALVILETPIYRRRETGQRMVEERHEMFRKRYGTRSDSMPSREYLTWSQIAALGRELNLDWKVIWPWYGWRWAMRPWVARVKRKREPSRFPILLAFGSHRALRA
jgi:SAM-dependent methyltransferase